MSGREIRRVMESVPARQRERITGEGLTRTKDDRVPHHDVVRVGRPADTHGRVRRESLEVSDQTTLRLCGLVSQRELLFVRGCGTEEGLGTHHDVGLLCRER